jgi:uncharacterized protein YjbJ (UPF0337 family)
MSTVDKSKNTMQIMKGKFKTTVGKATGNTSLQTHGGADQLMGHLKQFGEKVKDAFRK